MAFVNGYEYDIFISYAHVDNISFPNQGDGWIKQFYQNINLMLAKRFGRMDMVKIWWDTKKLDGSVLFDDSIAEGIRKSAIMICLNSPGYMASEYCQKELELFYDKANEEAVGLKVGDQTRILHVLMNNLPFQEWPKQLGGTTGFPFHDAETKEDFGDTVETISPIFKAQMRHLKDAVFKLLDNFNKLGDQPGTPILSNNSPNTVLNGKAEDANNPTSDFTIYMSEVPDTLRSPRKRIISELTKKGYRIISAIPPPHEVEPLKEATEKALGKAKMVVNLLDIYPGREIVDKADEWYPKFQTEISLSADVPQMIWLPSDSDYSEIEEAEYRNFLTQLEEGTLVKKDYEFIKGSKSTLSKQIMDFAETIKSKSKPSDIKKDEISVLLDTHENDHLFALDLSKTLLLHQIRPFINPQEDDPGSNLEFLSKRMSKVNKLIFLYGNVSKEWVIERINYALQLILINNYPIEDFYIYMAPPHKEDDQISINQRLLKVNVIDNSKDATINEEIIDKFLKDLRMPA
ncbi:toll/interleukin-1 receptor domain-containing protein [Maribacter sp. CXY002]|uniref:toll/interleukin-1 receptor domain-containing protein n=1 Tax=Maribacter luteocoastalis TaxID=3407671 RepID=UPI003B675A25